MNGFEQHRCHLVRDFFARLSDGDLEALRLLLDRDARMEVMRAVPGSGVPRVGTPSSTSSSRPFGADSCTAIRR